jgi:hypothetical protein
MLPPERDLAGVRAPPGVQKREKISANSHKGLSALGSRRGPRQAAVVPLDDPRRPKRRRPVNLIVTLQSLDPTAFRFQWVQDESPRNFKNLLPA